DTFAPAAPEGLTAVGSEGEVSLLWRPNEEEDIAGDVGLRGLPGGETLQPLTGAPQVDNTYPDVNAGPAHRRLTAPPGAQPTLQEPAPFYGASSRPAPAPSSGRPPASSRAACSCLPAAKGASATTPSSTTPPTAARWPR
ncbi:MAG: hypothetical protein OXG35_03965, partial [Acidobacteria bacterium]|nr:hypothetical protein [Acidobacteriota bacterium]